MCWEGATVTNPVQRCQDVPEGDTGPTPTKHSGRVVSSEGQQGVTPKEFKQIAVSERPVSSVCMMEFSGRWGDEQIKAGGPVGEPTTI